MFSFKYNNNYYELDFNGIKIIETHFTTNFIKQIFGDQENKCNIDGKVYSFKNIIYINELTKINDYLSLSRNGYIYKKIIDKLNDSLLINQELINKIIDEINQEFENDILLPTLDMNRLINSIFDLNDLGFISDQSFFYILNKIEFGEKKLIVFDNCKFATYNSCKMLLNNFNILIITSDVRNCINNYKELEICCFINNKVFEIINLEKLVSYLEYKMSEPITEKDLNSYINFGNSKKDTSINFYLKNL